MRCPICGAGQLEPGTTIFAADVEGTVVVVRGVPALVCSTCGEAFIDDVVSEELETAVADARRKGTESLVRRYEPLVS
ncbi:MAG: type II toxin-antitoxin system MqsA family antitoxin [Egibacteraceae bacterium]